MALYDPDAAGTAAPYLRLDSVTLMEIRSRSFDGKTAVWVPYSETGYTKGIVTGDGDKPGTKKVMRSDNKEKEYKVRPFNIPTTFPLLMFRKKNLNIKIRRNTSSWKI